MIRNRTPTPQIVTLPSDTRVQVRPNPVVLIVRIKKTLSQMMNAWKKIIDNGLSVRDAEALFKRSTAIQKNKTV